MKANPSDWYKHGWSLDIKNMSWVEDTESQVDFIIKTLNLNGTEKILDLACGYGRHALSFARRGYEVVGVDITAEYIEDAEKTAKEEKLNARFILSDIRDIKFENEYDVVLNLADGAMRLSGKRPREPQDIRRNRKSSEIRRKTPHGYMQCRTR